MKVRVIPAKSKNIKHESAARETPDLRVAAYCRVSTDLEEQESSYEAQVTHYTKYIISKEGWSFAGIYADEGISGTGTKNRKHFKQMIQDCVNGEIDMIITKSISRFARNTLDCLNYIRMLKELHIPVLFEKENINTMNEKGEVFITILASLAQQESLSISQNVRMGIQYQFQEGHVRINHTMFLGYTKDKEGNLIIVPDQAETVRRIYREYLEGKSAGRIAAGLEKDGIKTGAGKDKWYDSTIRSILTNEKYMGDALLQKYYTVNFLTKKKEKNNGVLPQYYIENDHEPIVSKETFRLVQAELQKRSLFRNELQGLYSARYALSGILICGLCGTSYRRMKANGNNRYTYWRCKKRLQKGSSCKGRSLREDDIHRSVLAAMGKMFIEKADMEERKAQIENDLMPSLESELRTLTEQISDLQGMINMNSACISTQTANVKVQDLQQLSRDLNLKKEQKRKISEEKISLAYEKEQLDNMLSYFSAHETDGVFRESDPFDEIRMKPILKSVIVHETILIITFNNGKVFEL